MGMKGVVIHIDRLVLKGFRHGDRHAIAWGLQKELERVFGDREAIRHLSAVGDASRLPVGSMPQRIGANVARGIRKEIKR
jgi:hypothetical protein